MKTHKLFLLLALFLFILSFLYRIPHLETPLWVDEFSTAAQANLLRTGNDSGALVLEKNNYTTHLFTALSFTAFGVSPTSLRFPAVLAGSLVPVALAVLGATLFSLRVGVYASFLAVFSYFQVVWSRQGRGYALQQLLLLTYLLLGWRFLRKPTWWSAGVLIVCGIAGILTHTSFILLIAASVLAGLVLEWKRARVFLFHPIVWFTLGLAGVIFWKLGLVPRFVPFADGVTNNLPYYHSFLWREQTVTTLLAVLGACTLVGTVKLRRVGIYLLVPILLYLGFFSFVFPPYVSRYLLPIFPLLLLLAALAIDTLSQSAAKHNATILGFGLVLFLLVNGDTFVLKPKSFYSVNRDMREIALIDYDQVYGLIQREGRLEEGKTAVIDTWPDRMKWYLGSSQPYFYAFRWMNEPGLVNGLPRSTPFLVTSDGEKYLPHTGTPPVKFIGELADLERVLQQYPRGFIWIDDSSLSKDVVEYAERHFYKELYLDHYTLDDNPYSLWPGTLYSWGVRPTNEN